MLRLSVAAPAQVARVGGAASFAGAFRTYAAAAAGDQQDVVVIGGGPGGYVAAIKAGQLGMKTTIIEGRGALGGTCLNVGCIPSKALLHTSHLYELTHKFFPDHGIKVGSVSVDVATMLKAKEKSVKGLTQGVEFLMKKNKVSYVKGWGKITGPNEVTVDLGGGKTQKVNTKNIVIATGSEPTALPFLPYDEKTIISSTGALSLPAVPKRMAVVGGGVIGLELGSVWRRLGAEVTVIEFLDEIGSGMDKQVAKEFTKILTKQKMNFKMGTKVTGAKKTASGVTLSLEPAKGGAAEQFETDVVLVSIGRKPYTTGLGLKELGVATDKIGRVEIDKNFRTNVPSIYAIGDVVRGPMLAHKAEEEGIAVMEHLHGQEFTMHYNAIPSVIYTHPEVAWVGATEEELKKDNIPYRVGQFPMIANSRAKTNDDTDGLIKVLVHKETDRVLGMHMIAAAAGEMIGEATVAVTFNASSEDIARTCHAHPTLSEAVKEACMAAHDKPIHT